MPDYPRYHWDMSKPFAERWPQTGDRLLSRGSDVRIADEAAERSYRLIRGFKRAADICVQCAIAEPYDRRNLVFPAIFNYRHYIELALKYIIEEYGPFAGVSLGARNHKLPYLWQAFVRIAVAFGNDPSSPAVVAVGACVSELDAVDAGSTAFRYARNLNGEVPGLPDYAIDLANMYDVMAGISNFFDCVDLDFSEKYQAVCDKFNKSV